MLDGVPVGMADPDALLLVVIQHGPHLEFVRLVQYDRRPDLYLISQSLDIFKRSYAVEAYATSTVHIIEVGEDTEHQGRSVMRIHPAIGALSP